MVILDVPLLVHEAGRRGITFEPTEDGLAIVKADDREDGRFYELVLDNKAAIAAYLCGIPDRFSPQDPSFSPRLVHSTGPSGLNEDDDGFSHGLETYVETESENNSISPLSPQIKGERLHVEGIKYAPHPDDGAFYIRECMTPLPSGCGLSGLNQRNPFQNILLKGRPLDEFRGLAGGLIQSLVDYPPDQPSWETLSRFRWGPAQDDDAVSGIDIPKGWRLAAASLPHERWTRWRKLSAEVLDDLNHPPTAADIRATDHAAYDLLRTDGEITR